MDAADNWLDFIAVALAAGAIIDVWNNGSIFATARAIVQAKQDVAKTGSITALWTELFTCPFCQSYHVPIYLYVLLLSADHIGGIVAIVARIIVYGWAATRIGNLLNGFLPKELQYERPTHL